MSNLVRATALVAVLISVLITTGCERRAARGNGRPVASPFVVEVVTLKTQPFRGTLAATGTLRANEAVTLQAERAGLVRQIGFEEGKLVQKGDVLL
ncbi:MAG: hypothetical protein ACK4UN_19190, partial [Limisphaerales bacterium]